MFITQITVYLENNQGTLRSLTKLLAEHNIDMIALSIADTLHFGLARVLVREKDIEPAIAALRENGFMAKTNRVLCVGVQNQPAGLDSVLAIIEDSDISIEYMYSLNYILGSRALLVMRLSSEQMTSEQIAEMLDSKGVTLINQTEINRL
ncbi:MAG: hypothetical protein E7559_07800 [Ruminococcaceae bacterium]|nr:hypothetical protein [Oscillospiraceae bacterium]